MASSRFFAGSDSDTESSSSDEELIQKPAIFQRRTYFDSESDDDVKRVVKSEKEKRLDEMQECIKKIRNSRRREDVVAVHQNFVALCKIFEKSKKIVEKEGVPHFYIKHLCDLEDFIDTTWEDKEKKKKMSKNETKIFTALRRDYKKHIEDFEEQITQYKEDPEKYAAEEESESEKEEEEESGDDDDLPVVVTEERKPKTVKNFDEMNSDDTWPSSSVDSSSSDDDYNDNPAARFLKREPSEMKAPKKERETKHKEKETKHKERKLIDDEDDDENISIQARSTAKQDKPKLFEKDEDVTISGVIQKLGEITGQRAKHSLSQSERLTMLDELKDLMEKHQMGPVVAIKVHMSILGFLFDCHTGSDVLESMRPYLWHLCLNSCELLTEALSKNSHIVLNVEVPESEERLEGEEIRLHGPILSLVERMDDEFIKMLQECDPHLNVYVKRLKDEKRVCAILDRLAKYTESRASKQDICRVKLLQIKHLYFKFDKAAADKLDESCLHRMKTLCSFIYSNDVTDRIRTQAILFNIYHLALHNKWFEARDLMLMSHLQDSSSLADIPTQICYNRAMVQLGLCAFRQGHFKDAHHCLVDIQSSLRVRELLAQGMLMRGGQTDKSHAEEKIEKRRQMPYHMHINLELLECTYLVSAMLIEIPYLAAHELDARRGRMSKNFHHVLKNSERSPLVGPPESMREHVVQACKAMKRGEWKACRDYLINDKMNAKVWKLFPNPEDVTNVISRKIQEEAVRTYLFSFSSIYDSISMKILSNMFDLSLGSVHSIVSKMIINEELIAALDEPTQTVIMRRSEPSRLQTLALQLSERVSQLIDNNERLMEAKQIIYQGKGGFDRKDNRGNQQGGFRRNQNQNRAGWERRPNYQAKNY